MTKIGLITYYCNRVKNEIEIKTSVLYSTLISTIDVKLAKLLF